MKVCHGLALSARINRIRRGSTVFIPATTLTRMGKNAMSPAVTIFD